MPTAAASDKSIWISATEARHRLAIGLNAFAALSESGRLTVRQIPGANPRYLAHEIDALADASTRRAVTA